MDIMDHQGGGGVGENGGGGAGGPRTQYKESRTTGLLLFRPPSWDSGTRVRPLSRICSSFPEKTDPNIDPKIR